MDVHLTIFLIISILCIATNKLNPFMTVLLASNRYLSYKGNNHQNVRFYLLCTVSFFLWYFSHMKNGCDDDLVSRTEACEYQVPPSVETGSSPYSFTTFDRNHSATSMFLSLEVRITKIVLLVGPIATHNHT